MTPDIQTQLKLAKELAETLEALAIIEADIARLLEDQTALQNIRHQILQSLSDTATTPKKASKTKASPDAKLTPRAVETAAQSPDSAKSEESTPRITPDPLAGAKAFDTAMSQQDKEKEAWKLYDDGIEKRSDKQMARIFAILGSHDFKEEFILKQIIWGIVAMQHGGQTLDSTKNLSKAWAQDLNDYLTDAKKEDLAKFIREPFPS